MLDPGRDAIARAPEHCGQGGAIRCCGRWDRAELDTVDPVPPLRFIQPATAVGRSSTTCCAGAGRQSMSLSTCSGPSLPRRKPGDRPAPAAAPRTSGGAAGAAAGGLPALAEAVSVEGWGRRLFELMVAHSLKRDRRQTHRPLLRPATKWLKLKNRDYTQKEGRGDLLRSERF